MINQVNESESLSQTRATNEGLLIEPSGTTPYVRVDYADGIIEMKGRSSPQDGLRFFTPIFESIKNLEKKSSIKVVFGLEYFNTTSAKCIFNVFKQLCHFSKEGVNIEIDWMYDEYDDDMKETGEDFEDITHLPFRYVERVPFN